MRPRRWIASLCLVLACAACTPRADVAAITPPTQPTQPLASGAPAAPDASCRVASDCSVKNVGNCCGYYPACVNRDAVVDPDAVRAACERSGMASVCGWRDIQSCECVHNQCRAASGPIAVDR
jgi:hypothetical protein